MENEISFIFGKYRVIIDNGGINILKNDNVFYFWEDKSKENYHKALDICLELHNFERWKALNEYKDGDDEILWKIFEAIGEDDK